MCASRVKEVRLPAMLRLPRERASWSIDPSRHAAKADKKKNPTPAVRPPARSSSLSPFFPTPLFPPKHFMYVPRACARPPSPLADPLLSSVLLSATRSFRQPHVARPISGFHVRSLALPRLARSPPQHEHPKCCVGLPAHRTEARGVSPSLLPSGLGAAQRTDRIFFLPLTARRLSRRTGLARSMSTRCRRSPRSSVSSGGRRCSSRAST